MWSVIFKLLGDSVRVTESEVKCPTPTLIPSHKNFQTPTSLT